VRPRSSIATRWALGYAAVILVAIALTGVFIDQKAERIALKDGEALLEMEARRFAQWLRAPEGDLELLLATSAAAADPNLKFGITLFDAQGAPKVVRGSARDLAVALPPEVASGAKNAVLHTVQTEHRYPYWVWTERADAAGYSQVTMYSRSFVRRARRVRYTFLAALPMAAALSAGMGLALARITLRPVAGIVRAVQDIRGAALDRRLPLRGTGDEFDQISGAMNAALDRVQKSMDALLHFSQDAAHQLRSPLAALRGRIEVALTADLPPDEVKPVLAGMLEDTTRLSDMIDAILALSRTAAGLHGAQREEVDLPAVLHEVVEFFEPLARDKGVALARAHGGAEPARVLGDVSWLRQCFVNLVENALRYTAAGGRVDVVLRRDGADAVVEVRDTGRGIPPGDLTRIFERFQRAAQPGDGPGFGLGLALAREIAQVHGGAIEAESIAGLGSTFRVSLPLAP
jgi:signal transduction histidine kinase